MKPSPHSKIIFINQAAGGLFRHLAEDMAAEWPPSTLYTGISSGANTTQDKHLSIILTEPYNRQSYLKRLHSGLKYFLTVFVGILRSPSSSVLFIVSNPPFIPIIGYLFKLLRRQKYVILVYDIYPDILVGTGKLSNKNPIVTIWRHINKMVWGHAEIVFTIGSCMAKTMESIFTPHTTLPGHVVVIPNCADIQITESITKRDNPFAIKYRQTDKLTVMYSGNFGVSHDFGTLLETAKHFAANDKINFFLIGEGAQKEFISSFIEKEQLPNVILLPLQDENTLPNSLATGDVAIISIGKGTEGCMVPSKIYNSMAVGSALLGISHGENELKEIISQYQCGINVAPGDVEGTIRAITRFAEDHEFFKQCKKNSRSAFENDFTRNKNSNKYIELFSTYIIQNERY